MPFQGIVLLTDRNVWEEPRTSIEANDLTCEELRISLVAKPSLCTLLHNQLNVQ